jgi:molybdopterin synthase sulfur carrier subunit
MQGTVNVKFLTRFIDITGEKTTQVKDVEDISLLIDNLCQKYGDGFKEVLLDENREIRDYLKVMINGEDIRDLDGFDTSLKDGDEIVMFQTIAGG